MIHFIGFNLNDKQKISINVAQITNIFKSSKEGETKICIGEDVYSVMHEYNDVIRTLTYYDDVTHVSV